MSEGRIDIHQHAVPQAWRAALAAAGGHTAGGWPIPPWSAEAAVSMMDRRGIQLGMLSVPAPGMHFSDAFDPIALTMTCNDEVAEVVRDRPDRFGMFAFLPLPDIDATLAEIQRADDTLGAQGFIMLSSTHGIYLGDPAYEDIWAELNRRQSVVFVHPNVPPIPRMRGVPAPVLDFVFDTTRTALDLSLSGTLERYPDVQVVLSHGGGFLPYAAARFAATAPIVVPGLTSNVLAHRMGRFWSDTALSSSPVTTASLLAFAEPGQLVYGSDWPFLPESGGVHFDKMLDDQAAAGVTALADAQWRNALDLLPSLAAPLGLVTLPRQRTRETFASQLAATPATVSNPDASAPSR